jgi:hypothetical protein
MSTTPIFPILANTVKVALASITAGVAGTLGNDTNGVSIYSCANAKGAKIPYLVIHTNDTVAKTVHFYLKKSSTIIPIGTVAVPASSGNTGTSFPIDALSALGMPGLQFDSVGKPYLEVENGCELKFILISANGSSLTTVYITAGIQEYE